MARTLQGAVKPNRLKLVYVRIAFPVDVWARVYCQEACVTFCFLGLASSLIIDILLHPCEQCQLTYKLTHKKKKKKIINPKFPKCMYTEFSAYFSDASNDSFDATYEVFLLVRHKDTTLYNQ